MYKGEKQYRWVQKPPFTRYPIRKRNWVRDAILVGFLMMGLPLLAFLIRSLFLPY